MIKIALEVSIGGMEPTHRCKGGGLNTMIMAVLTLKPHNSVSLCMSLAPPLEPLSLHQRPGPDPG